MQGGLTISQTMIMIKRKDRPEIPGEKRKKIASGGGNIDHELEGRKSKSHALVMQLTAISKRGKGGQNRETFWRVY